MRYVIKCKVSDRDDGSERWLVIAECNTGPKSDEYGERKICYPAILDAALVGQLKGKVQIDVYPE